MIRFINPTLPGSELDLKIDVVLVDTTSAGTTGNIKQGLTAKDGGMRIAGMLPGHVIAAAGYYQEIGTSLKRGINGGRTWLYTGTSNVFSDSVVIDLKEVQGDKSVISRVQLLDRGLRYQLDAPNLFLSAPTVEHQPDGNAPTNQTFTSDVGGYSVSIPDSLSAFGTFQLSAVDDSSAVYFFSADYTTMAVDTGVITLIKGPGGVSEATLDNRNNSLEKTLLLSTNYLVPRAGLSPSAIQVGPAQNLAVFPDLPLTGDNSITIRYSYGDVSGGSGSSGLEESLRIFGWSATARQWELVGGGVDTAYNEVTASIANTGVYAAFTTGTPSDVEEDGTATDLILPEYFEVQQNYPNPFNPFTVISYSLSVKAEVTIAIYNSLGQTVRIFTPGHQSAGEYSVSWDATDGKGNRVASGIYLYKVTAGKFSDSKKMILLK